MSFGIWRIPWPLGRPGWAGQRGLTGLGHWPGPIGPVSAGVGPSGLGQVGLGTVGLGPLGLGLPLRAWAFGPAAVGLGLLARLGCRGGLGWPGWAGWALWAEAQWAWALWAWPGPSGPGRCEPGPFGPGRFGLRRRRPGLCGPGPSGPGRLWPWGLARPTPQTIMAPNGWGHDLEIPQTREKSYHQNWQDARKPLSGHGRKPNLPLDVSILSVQVVSRMIKALSVIKAS